MQFRRPLNFWLVNSQATALATSATLCLICICGRWKQPARNWPPIEIQALPLASREQVIGTSGHPLFPVTALRIEAGQRDVLARTRYRGSDPWPSAVIDGLRSSAPDAGCQG